MRYFGFIYGFLSLFFVYQLVSVLTLDRSFDFGSISPFIATSFAIIPTFTLLLIIQGFLRKVFWYFIPVLIVFGFLIGTLSPQYWIQLIAGLSGYLLLSLILGYFSLQQVNLPNNASK